MADSSKAEAPRYDLRHREKAGAVTTAPLREIVHMVPQSNGPSIAVRAYQFLPFTTSDLVNWKASHPSYSESPQPLTELCETIMSTHNPTWADCRQLLMALFSREERARIHEEAVKILKGKVPPEEEEAVWIAARCPVSDPKWDYNKEEQMEKLRNYQQLLIEAMRGGMKKPVNLSKPAEIRQERNETPDHFYERLLDTYQRYTPLEVTDPANQRLINMAFVAQSWPDIKRKLQRQEGFAGMPISYLLELARRVYNNRDEEERKEKDQRAQRKTQLLAAALVQTASSGLAKSGTQGVGFRRAKKDECMNCLQKNHWMADCPFPLRPGLAERQHRNKKNHKRRSSQPRSQPTTGTVQEGVYHPAPQLPQFHPTTQRLDPRATPFQTQELVGVAEMDQWDVPE